MNACGLAPDVAALYEEIARVYPLRRAHLTGVEELRAIGSRLGAAGEPPVARVADHVLAGPGGPVRVRIYRSGAEPLLPALVWVHGGGWSLGGLDSTDLHARSLASEAGCAVVSVDHRHAPEHRHPAALEDVCAAVRWTAAHGAELGLDTERIAIGGISSGAAIAAAACLVLRDAGGPALCFQLLVTPPVDLDPERPSMQADADPSLAVAEVEWFWGLVHGGDPLAAPATALAANADSLAELPPALVIVADLDPLSDGAEAYGRRLAAAGVEASVVRYSGVGHALFALATAVGRASLADAAEGLRAALGLARARARTRL